MRDDEVIRVFHGFGNVKQTVIAVRNGLMGKIKVSMDYSYENGMNPIGLFVSQSFNVVKNKFGYGGVIIESNARVRDLDYPVWNNQSTYFGVGSDPRSFRNSSDRRIQRVDY